MKRMVLGELMTRIEVAAKSCPQGTWTGRTMYGAVVTDAGPRDDGYDGQLLAESCSDAVRQYIAMVQPRIILALLDKLRTIGEAVEEISSARSADDLDMARMRNLLKEIVIE